MSYTHLSFEKRWEINNDMAIMLGECKALITMLKESPLTPEAKIKLQYVTLKKGALSTTAIEGNSVTEDEYDEFMQNKQNLPQSRQYQQIEVQNIVNAINSIIKQVLNEHFEETISPQLIQKFHEMAMFDLDADTIPGRFRQREVTVGKYRPPEHNKIPDYIEKYCKLLHSMPDEKIEDAIVKAFVAHIYFEWIHPFDDGNGRTGRLLEYYILMRGGFPVIAGHVTTNFYNATRDKYYKCFDICRERNNLSTFLYYAIEGLRDGLNETAAAMRKSQIAVFWQRVIYDKFDVAKKTAAHRRKRSLMLKFPIDRGFDLKQIQIDIGGFDYGKVSKNTLYKDLRELIADGLLYQDNNLYFANYKIVCQQYFTSSNK